MKFATHEAPVNQVRFFPTAEALGTASSDGTVSGQHPSHPPSPTLHTSLSHAQHPSHPPSPTLSTPPFPSPSSISLIPFSSVYFQCRLFDMRAGQEITILSKGAIVLSAATLDFAKSGRILFVGYDDSTIRVWDVLKVGGAV